MEYGSLYFYTSTIYQWRPLISEYNFYDCITSSLSFLHKKKLIRVYGFVIMPNHIHLVWQMLKMNGKESPAASFKKFTAHEFEKHLVNNNPADLQHYSVDWRSRKYNFWQPEPHWFLLTKPSTSWQKINYMHRNPMQQKWSIVDDPVKYRYSSAGFYETGVKDFDFLYHYLDFDIS